MKQALLMENRFGNGMGGQEAKSAPIYRRSWALFRYAIPKLTFWRLLLFPLLFSHETMADILWMSNGDRLTGTIEEISDDEVNISLPYSQTLAIRRDSIKRWRLDSQKQLKPPAKTGIHLQGGGEASTWLWTGTADLNIKLKESDKETNNINLKGATEMANLDWRYSLDGEYIYETSNSVTDSHEYRLNPKLDFFFDAHRFLRSSIDAEYDMLDTNNMNLNFASGLGYRFWNTKKHRLELVAQLGLQRAYFTPDDKRYSDLFEERIINYPDISLSWDYRQQLYLGQQRVELFSKGTYGKFIAQPSPYLTRNQLVNGSLGVRYYFNDHLYLSWSSELIWDDSWLDYGKGQEVLGAKEWRHHITLGASL